ncbi:hypothetical protein [Modestobacter versicolor]|uniref:Uncharacterized protein n=1 Tax=Modestobacter versicolor TaxID=429133 RepID=A0A323VE16_9ACTN|nr:hypothetical protein [Modestobacter versicolor]MBB3675843.1 hypothetical protein [Modestobacter versicolor]PZA22841.1 hypothetical protein DMO24_02965 [Modestobacter versicolor]
MTDEQDHRMVWASQLADRVEKHLEGQYIYPHLYARLALLLQSEKLRFVQIAAEYTRRFAASGDLHVWTERHLAVVRFDEVVCLAPGVQPSDFEDHEAARVSVQIVPRSALAALELPSADADGQVLNGGNEWSAGLRDNDWSWPRLAVLTLTYKGIDKPILLPGKGDVAGFEALIPALLDDLAAR